MKKFIHKIPILLYLILFLTIFTSCVSQDNVSEKNIEDKLRIVSLAPSNTEILVGLSLGENIIGADEYSEKVEGINKEAQIFRIGDPNIEELLKLDPDIVLLSGNIIGADEYSEKVEGINKEAQIFRIGDPNIEELLKLDPDIVLLSGYVSDVAKFEELKNSGVEIINIETAESIDEIYDSILLIGEKTHKLDEANVAKFEELKNSGVEIINIETAESIDEIYDSILLIGEKTHKLDEANKMVEDLKDKIEEISKDKSDQSVTVYFEISQAPYIYSFGSDTFLNELLMLSGGTNIFQNLDGWISPNEESIINANPQIIFTNVDVTGNIDEIKSRVGWENIDAVKNNRVYYIDKDYSSRPSQFFINALYQMNDYIKQVLNEK